MLSLSVICEDIKEKSNKCFIKLCKLTTRLNLPGSMRFYIVAVVTIKFHVRGQLCRRASETFIDCITNLTLRLVTDEIIAS